MRLKFVPRGGCMPRWPGRGSGSYPYIGRKYDAEKGANVATEPVEVESHINGKPSADARRLAEDLCKRDGDLLPADEDTARFCGVSFAPLTRDADGEWITQKAANSVAKAAE